MRQIAPDEKTDCPYCHGIGLVPTRPGQRGNLRVAHMNMRGCPCNDPTEIWAGNVHPLVLADANGWVAWVDEGIKDDIEALWRAGIMTWVSCQGSPDRYVSLLSPTEDQIATAREILTWATGEECDFTFQQRLKRRNDIAGHWSYIFRRL